MRLFFIDVLPKFLFIERPRKDNDDNDNKELSDSVLTDVIHVPSMLDKCKSTFDSFDLSLPPPTRFDVAAAGGMGPCFGEPPFPSMPLPGGDEELYSPAGCRMATHLDSTSDNSPSFEKVGLSDVEKTISDSKFIAQHVRNKDSFENVSPFDFVII